MIPRITTTVTLTLTVLLIGLLVACTAGDVPVAVEI